MKPRLLVEIQLKLLSVFPLPQGDRGGFDRQDLQPFGCIADRQGVQLSLDREQRRQAFHFHEADQAKIGERLILRLRRRCFD